MTNISQHSSLSQADDVSSPYARVRSPAHAYDKLKKAEHPYAQVQPGTNGGVAQVVVENDEDDENAMEDPIQHNRESNQSLMGSVDIPAASAIAGRISASQDMPYMTPPIVQPSLQQHFSGDSQDSSSEYSNDIAVICLTFYPVIYMACLQHYFRRLYKYKRSRTTCQYYRPN